MKKTQKKIEKIYINGVKKVYLLLLTSIADNNAIYICADTHNFQIGKYTFTNKEVTKSFRTVICGTGGAHLDNLCSPNDSLCKKIDFSGKLDTTTPRSSSKMITFDGYGIKSYGYSKIGFTKNKLTVDFISLNITYNDKTLNNIKKQNFCFEFNDSTTKLSHCSQSVNQDLPLLHHNIDCSILDTELNKKTFEDECYAFKKKIKE